MGVAGLAVAFLVVVAAALAAHPAPVIGHSAVVQRTAGRVEIKTPGAKRFVTLGHSARTIPFGSTVAAPRGTVRITVASIGGAAPASAEFHSGQFAITQNATTGLATLRLNGPLARCHNATRHGTREGLRDAKRRKPKQRSLWGHGGSGHFQTQGNYAAAEVLGTVWLTTDSCQATIVSVAEGSVSVTDLVTGATQTVTTKQAVTVTASGGTSIAPTATTGTSPEAGARYAGTGQDFLNNAPTWTAENTANMSFDVSADASAVTAFKGSFVYYCGAGRSNVTEARMPVSSSGHFGARFTQKDANSTAYVAISGQFNTGGTLASVSYLVDYVFKGSKTPAHPYSTANPKALGCASWVRGNPAAG